MIRRFLAALSDSSSPLRRALGPTAAFIAVAVGVQYLQASADNEGRLLDVNRRRNERLVQGYDEAHKLILAMRNAIDHPSDPTALAAIPDNDTLVRVSEDLRAEDDDAGDVFADTVPTAS